MANIQAGQEEAQYYLLAVLERLGPLYPSQLKRFMFDGLELPKFDLPQLLYDMKEGGLVEQIYDLQGLCYQQTEAGRRILAAMPKTPEPDRFEESIRQYVQIFEREKDYLAQYTEQANLVFPVFLSIRRGNAVVFHMDVVVDSEETARQLVENWPQRAEETYRRVWDCIAPESGQASGESG